MISSRCSSASLCAFASSRTFNPYDSRSSTISPTSNTASPPPCSKIFGIGTLFLPNRNLTLLQLRQILQHLLAMLGWFHAGINLRDLAFRINEERIPRRHHCSLVVHGRSILRRHFRVRIGQQ